ncbi:MAG: hypothetical protein UY76_C0064G0009 [Candidatus Uhrbacteria bacterium GW2011_GWA2_52_8d]|uniref:Uncharacterized protein n=1 Tax=Candidatus Uhrbacteria bacterium GW2011_GWA2_52_8d TaxID=1618979 RepID=A0A0G1XK19_9BACT|nr:MAG: hypothetical protein UY76_C0064G0009 [Candidatus Uhrbacteria bacterium GW2011_GWA2_52_8d]
MSAEQLVLTLKGNRTSAPIQERPPETKQKGKDTLSSDGQCCDCCDCADCSCDCKC